MPFLLFPRAIVKTVVALLLILGCCQQAAYAEKATAAVPMVEKYLIAGELAKGERALKAHLEKHANDDQARFGLGMLQFLKGIEGMSQSFYKYGLDPDRVLGNQVPFLRIHHTTNPNPEKIDYEKFRGIFLTLLTDLEHAEATLAKVKSKDVQLRLHFGLIRLDLDGNGTADKEELLGKIYGRFNRRYHQLLQGQKDVEAFVKDFAITFDRADVYWLQGYCHLLMSMDQFLLAMDWEENFKRTGQVVFPSKKGQYPFFRKKEKKKFWEEDIADLIAFIHMTRVEVKQPKRLEAFHAHLKKVFEISRLSFKEILAETDDNEEWIPGPFQTGVIPGVKVTKEMVEEWHKFLDEMDLIFAGKKLIPHWRLKEGMGVNLKTFLFNAKQFDLVLLAQGSDLGPYVEKGEVTSPRFWRRLQRTFRGNFIGFAMWFN